MIYYLIIAAVILSDQVIKYIVSSNMQTGDTIPIIENIFHITYVSNTGAAFSLWEEQWSIIVAFPAIVLASGMVILFFKRKSWSFPMNLAIAFICGGGTGNFIDRVSKGYVVDFFDFRIFPVFNIADIFICVGCGLMILEILVLERKRGSK